MFMIPGFTTIIVIIIIIIIITTSMMIIISSFILHSTCCAIGFSLGSLQASNLRVELSKLIAKLGAENEER